MYAFSGPIAMALQALKLHMKNTTSRFGW